MQPTDPATKKELPGSLPPGASQPLWPLPSLLMVSALVHGVCEHSRLCWQGLTPVSYVSSLNFAMASEHELLMWPLWSVFMPKEQGGIRLPRLFQYQGTLQRASPSAFNYLRCIFPSPPLNMASCFDCIITPDILGPAAQKRCKERQGGQERLGSPGELGREPESSKSSLRALLLQEALCDLNLPK